MSMLTKSCSAGELTKRDLKIFAELNVHEIMSTLHIGALFGHSETHQNTLEQRLLKLVRAGYVAQLHTQRGDAKQFSLLQKGMNVLVEHGVFQTRKIKFTQPSMLFRAHDLSVSDFTISFAQTTRGISEPVQLLDEHSIFARTIDKNIRSKRGWHVYIAHPDYGTYSFWVKPDKLLGLKFFLRPEGKNERYYAVEIDKGSMDYTGTLDRPTILRKLLAYETTIVERHLSDTFDIPHPYVLFIAPTMTRRDKSVSLAEEYVADDKAARSMLFAVQPPSPTFQTYTKMSEMEWKNGRGEQAMFPL